MFDVIAVSKFAVASLIKSINKLQNHHNCFHSHILVEEGLGFIYQPETSTVDGRITEHQNGVSATLKS